MDDRVLAVMQPYFSVAFYNPSSPYSPAIAVRREYETAKHTIAGILGAKTDELVMTAGATESINLAFGTVTGHVVTVSTEHHAVLATARRGDHTIVEVDMHGLVSIDNVISAIRPDTKLVSIAIANNELGTIQPLRDIAAAIADVREKRLSDGNMTPLYFHTDASQGAGQLDLTVARLGVDMMTLNAGKMYGPKQVGLLWAASHVRIQPQIVGGGQESGLRSGTENVAGVIGFAKAFQLVDRHRKTEVERLRHLRDTLQETLTIQFPDAIVSGYQKKRLAGHLHISFPGIDAERLVFGLESRGVLVATGSACAANKGTRSHVLTAIGLDPSVADGSLRLTLGHLCNDDTMQQATTILVDVIAHEYERVKK